MTHIATIDVYNDVPIAVGDSYFTDINTTLNEIAPGVLGNDWNSESFTAVRVTSAGNGSLTFNTDGSFNYTPNVGFQGTDSFTYYATDGIDDSATVSVYIDVYDWGMLRATGPEVEPAIDVAPLTTAELRGVTKAAAAQWNRLIIDRNLQQAIRDVTFRITDLPGNLLGLGSAEVVLIDIDAAGYGWFIDVTPGSNEEFAYQRDVGQFIALRDGDAAGRMDLLTVALHELVVPEKSSLPYSVFNVVAKAATTDGKTRIDGVSHRQNRRRAPTHRVFRRCHGTPRPKSQRVRKRAEQLLQIRSGGRQHDVDRIAHKTFQKATPHPVVALQVADLRFHRTASFAAFLLRPR